MSNDGKEDATSGGLSSPLKWHIDGGKSYLAAKIIDLMPKRHHPKDNPDGWLHYVEPYAGGLSVLLAQAPEGISEVVNDIDSRLTNFWFALACPMAFADFRRKAEAIPFSERFFDAALLKLSRPCEIAGEGVICDACTLAFFVVCRQSLAGRMKAFAPLSRNRTRRGMNEQASAWLSAVEGLPEVHERLKRVVILNHEALDVIRQQDGAKTLFYVDCPYLHETRATTKDYKHEMTRENHARLLMRLAEIKGRFLLSGYQSDLYDEAATRWGWKREAFSIPNNAAGGSEKRVMTECVWMNY